MEVNKAAHLLLLTAFNPLRSAIDQVLHRYRAFPTKDWLSSGKGPEETVTFTPTTLEFPPDTPSVFYEHEAGVPYRGQEGIKKRIDVKIQAMGSKDRFKALLLGPAGLGKTTLAWIIASRIQQHRASQGLPPGRFFEILPNQINGKEELDLFVQQLQDYDIVFIDEIHVLKDAVGVEPLFHALADTGTPRYPLGQGQGWIPIPPTVSWIGATTDPGKMDDTNGGALRRRLYPELVLTPPSLDSLAQILMDQDMPIEKEAAFEIAQRSGGLPWQAIEIYKEARDLAKVMGDSQITKDHTKEAFDALQLDHRGLLPEDRAVLRALLRAPYKLANGTVRYRMSETALCAVVGIDRTTYKQKVQGKLLGMGYLSTIGGQSLTEKALDDYGHLAD